MHASSCHICRRFRRRIDSGAVRCPWLLLLGLIGRGRRGDIVMRIDHGTGG